MASGESGSGGTSVLLVTGLNIETRTVRVAAPGRVGAKVCATSPDDCCEEPAENACCPDGLNPSIDFTFAGTVGLAGAIVVIPGTLTLSGGEYSGSASSDGARITFRVKCVNGVHVATGRIDYATGEMKRFAVELMDAGSDLYSDLEIPGRETATIVVDSPCSTSPESGESGGGSVSFCGLTGLPTTLYAHHSGVLAAFGTQALVYDSLLGGYTLFPAPTGICGNSLSYALQLICVNSGTNEMRYSFTASPGTGFTATATPTSTSPLSITFTASTNDGLGGAGACPGSATVLIDTNP